MLEKVIKNDLVFFGKSMRFNPIVSLPVLEVACKSVVVSGAQDLLRMLLVWYVPRISAYDASASVCQLHPNFAYEQFMKNKKKFIITVRSGFIEQ